MVNSTELVAPTYRQSLDRIVIRFHPTIAAARVQRLSDSDRSESVKFYLVNF